MVYPGSGLRGEEVGRRKRRRRSLPGLPTDITPAPIIRPQLIQIAESDEEAEVVREAGSAASAHRSLPSPSPGGEGGREGCREVRAAAASSALLPNCVTHIPPLPLKSHPSLTRERRLSAHNRSGSEGVLFQIGGMESPLGSLTGSHAFGLDAKPDPALYFSSSEELCRHPSAHHPLRTLASADPPIPNPGSTSPLYSPSLPETEGSWFQSGNLAQGVESHPGKKSVRRPQIFVELDELYVPCSLSGDMEWKETGRWIKFEESLEVGAERWGKPKVPSLSFHSLLELRRGLATGFVSLNLGAGSWAIMAEKVVEGLVASNQILPEDGPFVLRSLLLPHRHVSSGKGPSLGQFVQKPSRTATYNSLHHYFYRQQSVVSPMSNASIYAPPAGHRGSADYRDRRASHTHGLPVLSQSRSSFGLKRLSLSPSTLLNPLSPTPYYTTT